MKKCLSCDKKYNSETWECPECGLSPLSTEGILCFSPKLSQKNDFYNPDYFEQLYRIESGNFWFRSRNNLIIWAMRECFSSAEKVLEIGCGTGTVLSSFEKNFPKAVLYGGDIYVTGLKCASRRLNRAKLLQMDALNIPYEGEFDCIGAFDVLEHIQDDEKVLSEINRSLKMLGGVILTVPQHSFMWSQIDEQACHVRRYDAKDLTRKIVKAGFEILKITSFNSLLFPLMYMSRQRFRWMNKKNVKIELEQGQGINSIFGKIMDFEAKLIYSGIRFPFGGSLLIVARKNMEAN